MKRERYSISRRLRLALAIPLASVLLTGVGRVTAWAQFCGDPHCDFPSSSCPTCTDGTEFALYCADTCCCGGNCTGYREDQYKDYYKLKSNGNQNCKGSYQFTGTDSCACLIT